MIDSHHLLQGLLVDSQEDSALGEQFDKIENFVKGTDRESANLPQNFQNLQSPTAIPRILEEENQTENETQTELESSFKKADSSNAQIFNESAKDSRICDEKSLLCERAQGRILGVCNRRARDAIKDLSREAESTSEQPAQETPSPFYVLNEILITKKDISGMTKIYATINNEHFHTYRADGLIIATPTGSSAYNISAGGSLVHPQCRVILLTPVCAHSLTQRPMIVSDNFCLQFSVEEDSVIMLDGQEHIDFRKGDTLFVQGSFPIQLIQHPKRSYFAVLEEKFGLGGKQV